MRSDLEWVGTVSYQQNNKRIKNFRVKTPTLYCGDDMISSRMSNQKNNPAATEKLPRRIFSVQGFYKLPYRTVIYMILSTTTHIVHR